MNFDFLTGSAAMLQTIFADHAATRGDHVWCTIEGEDHTYATIDARANQLAHALRDEATIGKGDAVAVCMANCAEYFVAMFAIHRLGGVYVPAARCTPPMSCATSSVTPTCAPSSPTPPTPTWSAERSPTTVPCERSSWWARPVPAKSPSTPSSPTARRRCRPKRPPSPPTTWRC